MSKTMNIKKYFVRGFTIVELLVVIVVIGVLTSITMVVYGGIQARVIDMSVESDLQRINSIEMNYKANHGTAGKAYYSGNILDSELNFTPMNGNVIDVVVNSTDYCIRGFNTRGTKNSLSNASIKESTHGSCALIAPSETMADGATVDTANLTAYWKFDEASGTAADATGNSHTGTLSGTTIPTWGTGKINNGLIFHGGLNSATSSYLSVPFSSDFTFGTGDFTIAFWVNSNNTSGYWVPIDSGYVHAQGILIEYEITAHLLRIYLGQTLVYTKAQTFTAGTSYYFVCRRIGTNLEILVNNVSLGIITNSTNILASTFDIFIGKYSGGEALDGYLDEFGIWKGHGLTDEEVTTLYNGGVGLHIIR